MKKKRLIRLLALTIVFMLTFSSVSFGRSIYEFMHRVYPPELNEPYFCKPINTWPFMNGNCTWYAYGRAYEILGEKPKFQGNAKNWWSSKDTYYGHGDINHPRVGSIAVWTGDVGHVAVVEEVYADGSVKLSESSYGGVYKPTFPNYPYWQTRVYTK